MLQDGGKIISYNKISKKTNSIYLKYRYCNYIFII